MKRVMEQRGKGFSLVEMVVASTILSMVVIAVCTLSTRSLSRVRLNREREMAWDLLDRQLTMIDYVGVDNFLNAGVLEGKFNAVKNMPEYTWQIQLSPHEISGLIRVYIAVQWGSDPYKHQISGMTIMSGTALQETPAEEQGTGTGQTAGTGTTGGGTTPGGATGSR